MTESQMDLFLGAIDARIGVLDGKLRRLKILKDLVKKGGLKKMDLHEMTIFALEYDRHN